MDDNEASNIFDRLRQLGFNPPQCLNIIYGDNWVEQGERMSEEQMEEFFPDYYKKEDKKYEWKIQLNKLEQELEGKILSLIGKIQQTSNCKYINFQIIKVLNYLIYEFSGWMQESIEEYKKRKRG